MVRCYNKNLSVNMRVHLHGDVLAGVFSSELMTIKEGKITVTCDGKMQLSPNVCQLVQTVGKLI